MEMYDQIILVMAICDLLGQPKSANDVETAIQNAHNRLKQSRQPPRDAVLSKVPSRRQNDETW
jgi:hypothetical protein